MSVLNSIRKKTGLLLGVIIIGLALFVIQDYFMGQDRQTPEDSIVGKIAGENVGLKEFNREYDENISLFKMNSRREITDFDKRRILEQTWTEFIQEIAYAKQYEELGIVVTSDVEEELSELNDMVTGLTIHPFIAQNFQDTATGEFDPALVSQFLSQIRNPTNAQMEQMRGRWINLQQTIFQDRLQNKYIDLLAKSNYITTAQAKKLYESKNSKASFDYVYVPFSNLPDSSVTLNEEVLREYFEEHKNEFDVDESRSLKYTVFGIVPSAQDTADVKEKISKLEPLFEKAENDTLFSRIQSDNPAGIQTYRYATLPPNLKTVFATLDSGRVYGPYFDGNQFKLYKVLDIDRDGNLVTKASHILLQTDTTMSTVEIAAKKELAQNVLKKALAGEDFAALAREYSEGPSSRQGGDLGEFQNDGSMVRPFEEAVFARNSMGVIPKLVRTRFGFHIINVTKTPEQVTNYTVAEVNKDLLPSRNTKNKIYREASMFAKEAQGSIDKFEKLALEKGLTVDSAGNVLKTSYNIGRLRESREVVRWAYGEEVEVGDVSDLINLDNQKYVVAALTGKTNEGEPTLEAVREEVKLKLMDHLKKGYIVEDLSKYTGKFEDRIKNYKENLAYSIKTNTVEGMNLSQSSIAGVGVEPKMIGTVFGLEKGEQSKPKAGDKGVFLIRLNSIEKAGEVADYSAQKEELKNKYEGKDQTKVQEAIKEYSEIEDNRVRYF